MSVIICHCGDEYSFARYKLGYRECLDCGEQSARAEIELKGQSIVPAGHKQGNTYVSADRRREHVSGIYKQERA